MAGYNGCSMSNNAVAAYEEGKKPLSKIKASDLKEAGWQYSLAFAKWLAKREGLCGYYSRIWEPSEWHHSSKMYNKVKFYSAEDLVDAWSELGDAAREALIAEFEIRQSPKQAKEVRVKGTYIEWTGSRRHPKANEVEFTGTISGNWIFLDNGGKKKADGNHIKWEKI